MEKNPREETIKEYVKNGGELFTVTLFEKIRDGGTKFIKTTKGDFYIHKDNKTFHSGYPATDSNLITNFLLKTYLINIIKSYIKRCENNVINNKKWIEETN